MNRPVVRWAAALVGEAARLARAGLARSAVGIEVDDLCLAEFCEEVLVDVSWP